MKNKTLIIVASFLAVIICLILTALLFYAVNPVSLIILSLTIGVITGICIAFLILGIIKSFKNKRPEKEKTIQ
jgi:high-affinity Fe2+/Pb2+ permease